MKFTTQYEVGPDVGLNFYPVCRGCGEAIGDQTFCPRCGRKIVWPKIGSYEPLIGLWHFYPKDLAEMANALVAESKEEPHA